MHDSYTFSALIFGNPTQVALVLFSKSGCLPARAEIEKAGTIVTEHDGTIIWMIWMDLEIDNYNEIWKYYEILGKSRGMI